VNLVEAGLLAVVALLAGVFGGAWWARRRRSQAALVDPIALVAEHLPVALLLFGHDGTVRFANRSAEQLLFAGEALAGQNFLDLLAQAPQEVASALSGSTDALFSLEQDGEALTFQVVRREVALDGAPHTLLLINALTREVARRELDVLKKVVRVISHELNNSLASVSSLVSSGRMIVDHPDKLPKLGRVLDGIEARTRHLHQFLGEYAQVSKLPRARPHEVQWAPMLERVRQLYPEVTVHAPPPGTGWFDENQVEQCLINLLKNAQEAGGAPEDIELLLREADGSLEIGVLDRGEGFSAEALEHGLLPFYSTKAGGSGVGLALCREVADGHRGSLRIKNREGGGSAVYLVLPLRGRDGASRAEAVALTLTRA